MGDCFKTNADGIAHSNMAWAKALGSVSPPGHLIAAPSVEDPAAAWLSGYKGYVLNETKRPNVISFLTLNVDWLDLYSEEGSQAEWFRDGQCSQEELDEFEPGE